MKSTLSCIAVALLLGSTAFADVSGDSEKIPGWVVAYENDATGATVRGSLSRLVRAARAGADIKIMLDGTTLDQTFSCASIIIYESGSGNEHLACSVNDRTSLIDETALPAVVVRASPYFTRLLYTTNGEFVLVRTTLTGSDVGTTTGTQHNLTWFARVR